MFFPQRLKNGAQLRVEELARQENTAGLKLHYYVVKRILLAIPILFALTGSTFILSHLIPHDVARVWAGPQARQESVERIRERYHLNDPIYVQYYYYMERLLHGDLGMSPTTHRPVAEDIARYLPHTIELSIFAMIVSLGLGIPSGLISALKRNKPEDHAARIISLLGISMPLFWFAILAQLVMYYYLDILPAQGLLYGLPPQKITGMTTLDSLLTGNLPAFIDVLKHIILPSFCDAYPALAIVSRLTRSSVLEVLQQDYVTTAKAKGLPERIILYKHVLRNSLITVSTYAGLIFGTFLGGSVLVETVFNWPGIGRYAVASTLRYLDYPAIMGVTLVSGVVFTIVNTAVDILYAFIDPRIRLG